jgi:hypothetical protein
MGMHPIIRCYLAEIGGRGGRKSRRVLLPDAARGMVRLREARRAYYRFGNTCFRPFDPRRPIRASDIPWIVERLRKSRSPHAWDAADRLDR